MRCESVPDPRIEHPRDAIIKVTACAICGSDLHICDGVIPSMQHGDVLGHETMGEVVEVGAGSSKLRVGDSVVVPFTIACGECFFCQRGYFSGCERSNPDAEKASKLLGAFAGGVVRIFAFAGRLSRRPSGVSACPVRRCRADQDPRRAQRRTSSVPVRHFPNRLHGGQSSATLKAARRLPFSAVGRWRSSPSAAHSSWAPNG
jgi:Alcohol dehydrogenase GroES-like domain